MNTLRMINKQQQLNSIQNLKINDLYNYKQHVFISNVRGVDIKIIKMFEMISI